MLSDSDLYSVRMSLASSVIQNISLCTVQSEILAVRLKFTEPNFFRNPSIKNITNDHFLLTRLNDT